jgi:hypothetical protein
LVNRLRDSTNAAKLAYNYVEADGSFNLNGGEGAVRFWFNPDWNGGTGTGAPGYWFELGDVYSPGGGWALESDSFGTGLSFVSGSNGVLTTYLTAPIGGWVSGQWHQVVLSYSASQTLLFLDGAPAASGPGLAFEPDLGTRLADGFTVGSDPSGWGQAGGVFDELATFNCPMTQAEVTTNYPYPAILAQPQSQTVNLGGTVTFSVSACGTGTLTYQWRFNGTNISGATSSTYSISSVQTANAGTYSVVVANSAGSATSSGATLTVNLLPSITSQPASQTVDVGMAASFSVSATGAGTLTYQWILNGTNIPGGTASTYSIACAQATDAGTYFVVVGNTYGSATSSAATLTVNPPIQFGISFTNQYVNQANVPLWLDIQAGTPYYYTVMLDSTSFSTASWTNYTSSNITVNLGGTPGWHTVWVGLCDMLGGVPTWNSVRLDLLLTPPAIIITNLANNITTAVPYVQVQGFSPESLQGVSFDVSNATGVVANQHGLLTGHYLDINLVALTTNYFQCYDIPLTIGLNTITVHATDLAGNQSASNVNITLDYSITANPAVSLTWPADGMQICGSNFTLRGLVDDPTASVSAVITDTNGDSTTAIGEVERTGVLWVENLPLNSGTNWITLSVTNAAGLGSQTSFSVVQSSMTLALTSIYSDLWLPTVNMSGTISDTSYSVSVNGVQATNNGSGVWSATNVPISSSGVASFDLAATPASGGGPLAYASFDTNKPSEIVMESAYTSTNNFYYGYNYTSYSSQVTFNWGLGGAETINQVGFPDTNDFTPKLTISTLSPDGTTFSCVTTNSGTVSTNVGYFSILPEAEGALTACTPDGLYGWGQTNVEAKFLHIGGQGVLGLGYLVRLSATATVEYVGPFDSEFDYMPLESSPIPCSLTTIDGKSLGSVGYVYAGYPGSTSVEVTPQVVGVPTFAFAESVQTPSITGLTVVSNATQINASNWVTIMTNGGYVTLQASMSTTDTNAAEFINWSCGQPVPGQPFQRQVSTSTPTNFTVTASVGSSSATVNVWIVWGRMKILLGGPLPTNAPPFATTVRNQQYMDGTSNVLGPVYWDDTNGAAWKICTVATLLPPGVGAFLSNGFATQQFRWTHRFENGVALSNTNDWNTNWVYDSPINTTNGTSSTTVPDSSGNLYSIDAPYVYAISGKWGITNSLDTYSNFKNWLTLNGLPVSNTNLWYYAGKWTNSGPQFQVHMNLANTNNIPLPTSSYYNP